VCGPTESYSEDTEGVGGYVSTTMFFCRVTHHHATPTTEMGVQTEKSSERQEYAHVIHDPVRHQHLDRVHGVSDPLHHGGDRQSHCLQYVPGKPVAQSTPFSHDTVVMMIIATDQKKRSRGGGGYRYPLE
jgi:hypothetical protein